MRSRKYTRELLEPIVRSSDTWSEVIRALGLPVNGGNHRLITARVRNAGLDTSHFRQNTIAARVAAVPSEVIANIVGKHTSLAGVLRDLGFATDGRAHHEMKQRMKELGIDTSHFRGSGWSRGETTRTHPSVARYVAKRRVPDELVFIANSTYLSGTGVARRLLARGWPYQCAWCGVSAWRGKPLILHLDHINGINNDHRLENLRFLCPNCHSQTETYSNRRR
jgi:5-methylcytosine-specific restriction endonuclease McrA